jgi:hypothetical protein
VSFRDWSEEDKEAFDERIYTDIYNNIEGVLYLNDEQADQAEALFDAGWLTFGEYSKEQLDAIRDEFFDLVGLDEEDFDWVTYRDDYSEVG